MQKDFSYTLKIDDLKQTEQNYHIQADSKNLAFLQDVFKVEKVLSFTADISLKLNRKIHRLDIKGEVRADFVLKSVISLEDFEKTYIAPFAYWYDTSLTYQDLRDMDLAVFDDAPDIIENGQIDLVQIAIEQLSLVLDDHPRKDGEIFEFQSEFDEETTQMTHPFAALKKLK